METNGSLLKGSIHPSFGQYLRFCHEGVVWQFLALPFWVKHSTTSVYNGHSICRVLRPFQWGQPPRPSGRLADWKPISEELAKQQTQWLLDLCTRLGWVLNVEKSSLTPSHVAIFLGFSLDTRVGLAYPSERRIERWLSISEDLLAGQAQPALLWLRLGAPSFPRETSSLRPVAYPTHSVPTSLRMVSNQRPSSDPGQSGSRDPGFHSLMENSFESPQRNPTSVSSDRSFPLHRLKCCGLGWMRLAWSPSLQGYSPWLQCCHYVRQCLWHCLSEKSGGHSVSTDVPHGHRYLRMGRRMGHNTDTQTSSWASQCVSRSSEPQRSDSENRMESESSRSMACIPSLGQSTYGSVCTQVQPQTSNLHVSDSRTGGLEGRQSSPIMGRSVRTRTHQRLWSDRLWTS